MTERRSRARRKTSDYFLCYQADTEQLIGRIHDLTEHGAKLITDSEMSIDQQLPISIVLPSMVERRKFLRLTAITRWSDYNRVAGWYETGVEFIDVPEPIRLAITTILDQWFSQPEPGQSAPSSVQ